jgi:hypothetical protein
MPPNATLVFLFLPILKICPGLAHGFPFRRLSANCCATFAAEAASGAA